MHTGALTPDTPPPLLQHKRSRCRTCVLCRRRPSCCFSVSTSTSARLASLLSGMLCSTQGARICDILLTVSPQGHSAATAADERPAATGGMPGTHAGRQAPKAHAVELEELLERGKVLALLHHLHEHPAAGGGGQQHSSSSDSRGTSTAGLPQVTGQRLGVQHASAGRGPQQVEPSPLPRGGKQA